MNLRFILMALTLTTPCFGEDTIKPQDESPAIEETFVFGEKTADFTIITQDTQKLIDLPGALGDPLSAVFSLPGVLSSSGSRGEPAVRGSSPEDNAYIVDFLPSGYVFHTFTNSVFSEFIVQDFRLYSAGFGPEFSDVTGAVFDIRLRQPKNQRFGGVVDLSLLRSGIFLESGLGDNSAFYLSARKSLIHLIVPEGEEEDGVRIQEVPQDEDYQFKYHWDIGANSSLVFSANGASDFAEAEFTREADFVRSNPDFQGEAKLDSRFNAQNVRYNFTGEDSKRFTLAVGQLKENASLSYGDDYFNDTQTTGRVAKTKLDLPVLDNLRVQLGGQWQQTNYDLRFDEILITCTEFDPDCSLNRRERVRDTSTTDIIDTTVFANARWLAHPKLNADIGVQSHTNDYTGERFNHPRASLAYDLSDTLQVNTKFGTYDRLQDIRFILPERGNPELASQRAIHRSAGIKHSLPGGWTWELDMYYKSLSDLPLALRPEQDLEQRLYSNAVSGTAYGADLLINKARTDKWYGWLALSYSKSERTNLITGERKRYFLDTPLVANWVMNYQFNARWDLGWRWQVKSGSAYTPIIGLQENPFFDNAVLPEYGDPYSDRLPIYSRLDVRFKWRFTIGGNEAALIVDIINALNQKNIGGRGLDYDQIDSIDDEVKTEDSVSPGIIPTFGFRYAF